MQAYNSSYVGWVKVQGSMNFAFPASNLQGVEGSTRRVCFVWILVRSLIECPSQFFSILIPLSKTMLDCPSLMRSSCCPVRRTLTRWCTGWGWLTTGPSRPRWTSSRLTPWEPGPAQTAGDMSQPVGSKVVRKFMQFLRGNFRLFFLTIMHAHSLFFTHFVFVGHYIWK